MTTITMMAMVKENVEKLWKYSKEATPPSPLRKGIACQAAVFMDVSILASIQKEWNQLKDDVERIGKEWI